VAVLFLIASPYTANSYIMLRTKIEEVSDIIKKIGTKEIGK
jgi:hypothetical protein